MNNEEKITRYLGKIAANTERIARALEARGNPRQVIEGYLRKRLDTKEEYAEMIKGWIDGIIAKMNPDMKPEDREASEMVIKNLRYSLEHIDKSYEDYLERQKHARPRLASEFLVSPSRKRKEKVVDYSKYTATAEQIADMVYAGASDEELNAVICQSMVAIKEAARKNRLDEEMTKAILEG